MPRPTISERKAQAEALRKIKPTVKESSFFGDNHHNAIDAQIEVLEDVTIDEGYIQDKQDDEDWADNVADAANDALNWTQGSYTPDESNPTGDLVGAWKELVR